MAREFLQEYVYIPTGVMLAINAVLIVFVMVIFEKARRNALKHNEGGQARNRYT